MIAVKPLTARPAAGLGIRKIIWIAVGAFCIAFGSLLYLDYNKDINAAKIRVSSGSRVIDTPCGPIEYAVAGEGPPVLVIHGAGGGFDQGIEFGQPLTDAGFRVIAMSRFGYLRTPFPADSSPAAQARAHACLLDALDAPRAAILGGSAGAPSAMEFCFRYPKRCPAMILVVPMVFAPHLAVGPPQQPSALTQLMINTTLKSDFVFWVVTKFARETMIESVLATPRTDVKKASANEQQRVFRVLRKILPVSPRKRGLRNDAGICGNLPRYELEKFTMPTLVISVENDLFGTYKTARYTAEHIPGARFFGYRTGGHTWIGHEKEVSSELVAFLKAAR